MKKILVIYYKKSVGDSLVVSSICNTLKEEYKDSQIDLMSYESIAPLFRNHKYINNVLVMDRKENPLKAFFKLLKKIRAERYDAVIDCRSIPFTGALTLLSGAKTKIAKRKKYRDFFYTHIVDGLESNLNQVKKYHLLLGPLNIGKDQINPNYCVNITDEEKDVVRNLMSKAGIDFSRPLIPFAINSRQVYKKWKEEYVIEVVNHLIKKYDAQIIFYYSPDEKNYAKELHNKMGDNPNIFSNIETKNLRQLAALFSLCDIFVGNEGGPRHLAESVGLINFSIYSPSSLKSQWLPNENRFNQAIDIYEVGGKVHDDIKPHHVIERVDKMIEEFDLFSQK